jgi:hypothetical protein
LKQLFLALADMQSRSALDLDALNLMYVDHLSWLERGQQDSSCGVLLLLFQHCWGDVIIPSRINDWFGGETASFARFVNCGTECKRLVHSAPFVATVQIDDDSDLQSLINARFSDFGVELTSKVKFGEMTGDAIMFEKIATCPRILGIQIVRDKVTSILNVDEMSAFYSTLTYGMELDLSEAVISGVESEHCCKYQLVSMIVRQTSWSEDSTNGHYEAVCSAKKNGKRTIEWFLLNDSQSRKIFPRDVCSFTGKPDSPHCFGEATQNPRENKLFVEYFHFVRQDCLDSYYADEK